MNKRTAPGLPILARKPSKAQLNTSESLKKPKNFINFDDSEIFCDIKPINFSETLRSTHKLKSSRTQDSMVISQSLRRKDSEHKLRSLVMDSMGSTKKIQDQKRFDILSQMMEFEQYFSKVELPPTELHLSSDLSGSFNREHQVLDRCMRAVELLADSNQRAYPKTTEVLGQVLQRNIYFDFNQLAPFKYELESVCSPECVALMQSGDTTWRTFASILACETARGLAQERELLQQTKEAIEVEREKYRVLEFKYRNEESKLIIQSLESTLTKEQSSKLELEEKLKDALDSLSKLTLDLKKSDKARRELERLQSQVEFEYESYKKTINKLESDRAEALAETEKFKNQYTELLFSFNETVEASVKMMVKLQAAKREIDHLTEVASSIRRENADLVDKHLIGADQLTPRPHIREMIDETRVKLEFPNDYDNQSTEAKVAWLVSKIHNPSKIKVVKKKSQLKRNSSLLMSSVDQLRISITGSKQSEKVNLPEMAQESPDMSNSKPPSERGIQEFYFKINNLKTKFNQKAPEMN